MDREAQRRLDGIRRGRTELENSAIDEFVDVSNENPRPFQWIKTADDILASIARFAQRTAIAHAK